MWKNALKFIFETLKIVVISLAIIIPIRYFLIQPFYVKGASMEPNFHDFEYLIIDEISYRFEEPKRGEVIVFRYPNNPQEYFIKRVIGLPGETVEIKGGRVYIINSENPKGFLLQEPYLSEESNTYSLREDTLVLSEDEYYVLGDNRTASKDSRTFGAVNKSFIIGRVWLRGWPLDRMQVFNELPKY
ncbi:MAG: signal peptidase I [Candidatus Pacebacteria bacterium]|nr:signal peptidase I [Candidatus Paceibacterota bacterium]